MAKVGYISEANPTMRLMRIRNDAPQYGVYKVVEESVGHETLRPRWKQLMSNLEEEMNCGVKIQQCRAWFTGTIGIDRTIPASRSCVLSPFTIKLTPTTNCFRTRHRRKYWPCSGITGRSGCFCGSRQIRLYACSRVSVFRLPKKV